MSRLYKPGFTIIETMLFLAITGVLIASILVGTGASMNVQRYRDSVTSLKALIQQQYSDATNVQNQTPMAAVSCNSNAVVSTSGATEPRGQSDCVVMGRYMSINQDTVTTKTVIGHSSSTSSGSLSDVGLMQSYNLATLDSSTETSQLDWGTRIAWPSSGGGAKSPTMPRSIAILIIRSPQSGQTYTFTADDITTSLKSMIVAGVGTVAGLPGQAQRTVCVDSNGLFAGNGMAVSINAYASSPTDIEIRSNGPGYSSVC